MSDGVGCGALVISAIVSGLMIYFSGSILLGAITFIVGFGYFIVQIQEGLSKGSGYRQEQQNKQILEELKKQNKDN